MSSRRGNGEGSVYRRKDGRWVAAYKDVEGKRTAIYGAARADVADRLSAALKARSDGTRTVNGRLTFGAFLEQWISAVKPSLRARTWTRYEELLRIHVVPDLGKTSLAKLGPDQLQQLYARKLGEGSSPTTVHHVHAVIHRALAQAERWSQVPRNVASLVDAPKMTRHEMATLTEEQLRSFDDAVAGDNLETLFVLAFTTGMRLSEILGLRWRDVDLERADIHLRTTLERENGTIAFVQPKTTGSRRHILLTDRAVRALRRQRVIQAELRIATGTSWADLDLVFTDRVGEPIAESTLRAAYIAALKRAGLPRMRFHDLRHTAATIALGRGVHPKIVSEMLGHSRIAVTLDTYSHVTPTMQRDAVAAMEAALGGAR